MSASLLGTHPILRTAIQDLTELAHREGLPVRVTSGKRSFNEQRQLFERYRRGLQPLPVARPGTSTHQFGLAADIVSTAAGQTRLAHLAQSLGLVWGGPRDPVHFQIVTFQDWASALRLNPRQPLSFFR